VSGPHGPETVPAPPTAAVRFDDGYDDDHSVQAVIKGIRKYAGDKADHETALEFIFFWATLSALTSEQISAVLARFAPPAGAQL